MKTSEPYIPDRGDIVWIELTPPSNPELAGRGPAFVCSPKEYNGTVGLALICPITTHAKGYPYELPLPKPGPFPGAVLADHMTSVDWRMRNTRFLCRVPSEVIRDTIERLHTLLIG